MPWYKRPCALVPFLALLMIPPSYSQSGGAADQQSSSTQQPAPSNTVLRATTRLVVVDVVAVNGKGDPVPGLKADDFTLLEDGRPQKISGFSFQHAGSTALARAPLPENIISNSPLFRSGSLDVILFDTLNGDFTEQAYARDELIKFLNMESLQQPLAIYAMQNDLKLLHDFSTDNQALSATMARYKPPIQNLNPESMESRVSVFSSAGAYHTEERSIETTLSQLNVLAKILKGYPGRKNLIWLTESFPLSLFPESNTQANQSGQSLRSAETLGGQQQSATAVMRASPDFSDATLTIHGNSPTTTGGGASAQENLQTSAPYKSFAALVKRVADALMAAQVAVYVVDAGALGKNDHLAAQHTMNIMADSTGGKAFKNSNNLALSLKTSLDDGSVYYTLEYYPDNRKWDGRFRSIQVKSSLPGVSLRYRQGYYALDPDQLSKEASDSAAENFSRLLQIDAPAMTTVLFQAQVLTPSDKNKKATVTFHVDPETIAFEHKANGEEYAKISCTVWAYGKDKDKPQMFSSTVNANLKASEFKQIRQQRFLPCGRELELGLKPGSYTLRLGVLDRTTNKIGTGTAQITVP